MTLIKEGGFRAQVEHGKMLAKDAVASGLKGVGLRDDVSLTAGSNNGPLSPEMKAFLGVRQMRIYRDPGFGIYPSHTQLEQAIRDSENETGAEFVENKSDANVIFVRGSYTEDLPGMQNYRNEFQRASGVAVPPALDGREKVNLETSDVWRMQGHGFTQYGMFPEVNRNGETVAFWPTSMEGAYHRSDVTTDRGARPAVERLNFIAATEKVTERIYDREFPLSEWNNSDEAREVIKMCRMMREWGLMPPVELESVTTPKRKREIMLFLGVAGLSTGNASVWERGKGRMRITASGVDKGNLEYKQVLPVTGFTPNFDGVIVGIPETISASKPSVEAFDNYLNFVTSLGVDAGYITEPDIEKIIAFAQDTELVNHLKQQNNPSYILQLHFHAHAEAVDPNVFAKIKVNSDLTPYGDANSSCGTRPLAYYTAEMLARGMLEHPGKILIAEEQKHGSQIASPFNLETTLRLINPTKLTSRVIFRPVSMHEREAA